MTHFRRQRFYFSSCTGLILLLFFGGIQCKIYYCSENEETVDIEVLSKDNDIQIKSYKEGEKSYGNNLKCSWKIKAATNHQILLTVLESSLQWAPVSAICDSTYDYMEVNTTNNHKNSTLLALWCGESKPGWIISPSSEMFVTFSSNDRNPYKYSGVKLQVEIFNKGECPPQWIHKLSADNSSKCYGIRTVEVHWYNAFKVCNQAQSNLATLVETDLSDIKDYAKKTGASMMWIGLNDIKKEDYFVWLDKTPNSLPITVQELVDRDSDCVFLKFDDETTKLISTNCFENERHIICERYKDTPTIIYNVPQLASTEIVEESNKALIIGVIVGLILLVIIGIAIVVIYTRRKSCRRSTNGSPNRQNSQNGIGQTRGGNNPLSENQVPAQRSYETESPPSYRQVMKENFNLSVM